MKSTAEALAQNDDVRTEDIADAVDFLQRKINATIISSRPVSFAAYRSKVVMEMALNIRTQHPQTPAPSQGHAQEAVRPLDETVQ